MHPGGIITQEAQTIQYRKLCYFTLTCLKRFYHVLKVSPTFLTFKCLTFFYIYAISVIHIFMKPMGEISSFVLFSCVTKEYRKCTKSLINRRARI